MQRVETDESGGGAMASLPSRRHFAFSPSWVPWGTHTQTSGSRIGLTQMKSMIEENDKDDSSEDDAKQERQSAFVVRVGKIVKATFPNCYPFMWMLLPFAFCGLMFLLSFGKAPSDGTFELAAGKPSGPGAGNLLVDRASQDTGTTGSISISQLQNEGYLLLLYCSLCNVALWLIFMLLRLMVMVAVMNLLPYEIQVLAAFLTPLDPEIIYVAWSITAYGFWKATIFQSDQFIIPFEGSSSRIGLYRSHFFGDQSMKQDLVEQCNKLWLAIIFLALRHLLLSMLTFLFEIGFMKSMNAQLASYLSKAAASHVNGTAAPRERPAAGSQNGYSRVIPEAVPTNRATSFTIFRFRNLLSKKGHKREYFGSGMPRPLTKASIKRTASSGLHNWILIHYVLQYPPAFFLPGRRVELLSKATTATVAEEFFAGLIEAARARFPSSTGIEVTAGGEHPQQEAVADQVSGRSSSGHVPLPRVAINVHVNDRGERSVRAPASSYASAAAGASHNQEQGGKSLDDHAESLAPEQNPDTATDRQGATFKAEEAQQRICGGEGTGPSTVGADVGTTPCSSESLSRVTSLAHSGITALLRYSLLQQYPSERIGQLLASSEPESPPLSRCTSLLGESLEEPIEAVPVTLRQEPQPQARGPTSSLFATSLPHPPWIRVPPAAGAPAESGHLPPNARWAGQVPTGTTYSEPVFSKELVEVYLKPDEATEFMNQLDLGGYGKINGKMFKRGFFTIYKLRGSFIKAVNNQVSICNTVRKMVSLLLWVVTVVALLLLIGLNFNTVLISGAATLSALTVALSNLYQEFVGAVIFIAISNPYNVGDRICIGNGIPLYVKRIRTYTTEFEDIYGKQVLHSNDALWKCVITNESRAKNASHNFIIRVQIETQISHLRKLEKGIKEAMDSQPMDFVKDSFLIFISNFEPGKWLEVSIWVTTVENWGNITKTLRLRTDIFLVIQSICYELGITYHEPHLPVQLDPGALGDLLHTSGHETRPGDASSSSAGDNSRGGLPPPGFVSGLRRRFGGGVG